MTHSIPSARVVELLKQCSNCDPALLWEIDAGQEAGPNLEPLLHRLVRYRVLDRIAARAMLLIANGQLDARDLKQLISASRTRSRVSTLANKLRSAQPAPTWTPPAVGSQVGPYTLGPILGQGGCGVVYQAQHPVLQQPVAIKFGKPHRLQREATTLAAISHKNIIRLWDAFTTDNGLALVLEHLSGGTVKQRLARRKPCSIRHLLWVAVQAACGLQALHQAGKTHGDVKPSNLMYHSGQVKLIDFGLAQPHDTPTHLQDDKIEGSWPYTAPEQFDGHRDARSDLYALGLVLLHLLTGKPVITATTEEACRQAHRNLRIDPPHWTRPDVSRSLSLLLLQMVKHNPAERPATCSELLPLLRSEYTKLRQLPGTLPTTSEVKS